MFNCGPIFPFLIEVCWFLYYVVYCQCKFTQLKKQDNRKCFLATDGILEQNSVHDQTCYRSHGNNMFKKCCFGNMFDHGRASLVFLWSAMVVYIHKVSWVLTGKNGKKKSSRRNDDQFWIWPHRTIRFDDCRVASRSLDVYEAHKLLNRNTCFVT